MDKNRFIRLFLISVSLLVYYFYVFNKPREENQPPTAIPASETITPLSAASQSNNLASTPFAIALHGEEKVFIVENELIKVFLSTKGGSIKKVVLKKYKDKNGQELVLLDDQSSTMGLVFPHKDTFIKTSLLHFQTQSPSSSILKEAEQTKIVFRLAFTPSQYLEQSFDFSGNSYQINYAWRAVSMEPYLQKSNAFFIWNMDMRQLESDIKADVAKSTINYYSSDQTFNNLKENSTQIEKKKIETPLKWVSIKQRFFSSAIIAEESFASGDISLEPASSGKDITKTATLSLALSEKNKENGSGAFTFFFGPNEYKTLQKVTKDFEQNLPLGWVVVKWVNQGLIIPLFSFLEKHFSNYGLIIFLLVIAIKLLLAPLSYKSFISMAKMKAVKPELDKIKEKYGNNLQKMQAEQMAFYKELGINPLSGCVPLLLQMPILLAMFQFFPNAIALRKAPFLWAHDLSTYDSIIRLPFTIPIYGNHISLFTLLMVCSTILYTWSSNQGNATEGPMKILSYIMPITFMFVLNSFPAGLSFYYCVSNIATFLQQTLTKYFVNEESVKEKLISRQKRVKQNEKSSFQSRVVAAMQANNKKKK
ncbi:membrane protein insertase YidC [Cardinium endosymbiont of Tipula unca]|uniref:membrane protein insertase YidC n=1 Tax=Cardinium endosymbiont of Tipula unca TaxID=3066216 RepID=UPI0030D43A8C